MERQNVIERCNIYKINGFQNIIRAINNEEKINAEHLIITKKLVTCQGSSANLAVSPPIIRLENCLCLKQKEIISKHKQKGCIAFYLYLKLLKKLK